MGYLRATSSIGNALCNASLKRPIGLHLRASPQNLKETRNPPFTFVSRTCWFFGRPPPSSRPLLGVEVHHRCLRLHVPSPATERPLHKPSGNLLTTSLLHDLSSSRRRQPRRGGRRPQTKSRKQDQHKIQPKCQACPPRSIWTSVYRACTRKNFSPSP